MCAVADDGKSVELTATGRTLLPDAQKILSGASDASFSALSNGEQEYLTILLETILAHQLPESSR